MLNRPFPSFLLALSQDECSWEIIHVENDFRVQVHFHNKGFARRLVLKQRHRVSWKWPIVRVTIPKLPIWN